jgi:hypothetical protein
MSQPSCPGEPHDGAENPGEQGSQPWLVRTWPLAKAALQLALLALPEERQGLHLTMQTLLFAGDIAAATWVHRAAKRR